MAATHTLGETVVEATVVPASTTTPPVASGGLPTPPPLPTPAPAAPTIQMVPASAADSDGDALVDTLVAIVNAVYGETEGDIFVAGYQRVRADEMRRLVRAGELAVVYLPLSPAVSSSSEPAPDGDEEEETTTPRVAGCMRIGRVADSAATGELGMVAVSPAVRGSGLGRAMAAFAEDHCRRVLGLRILRLELLVPRARPDHPFKMRLQAWYERMGFRLVRLGVFQDDYPELAGLLCGPCEYRVFEKSLV